MRTHERIAGGDGSYDLDATVRFRAFGLDFLALVEVKHYRNPIKRELVQVLHAKVQSVGAHKGIMFATAHFQRGALDYAKAHGIALVFVTEGRLMIERRSGEALPPISKDIAAEWGIAPIAGTFYGRGDEGSTACVYIGADRPDLVRRYVLGITGPDGRAT